MQIRAALIRLSSLCLCEIKCHTKKQNQIIHCLQEMHQDGKDIQNLKSQKMEIKLSGKHKLHCIDIMIISESFLKYMLFGFNLM